MTTNTQSRSRSLVYYQVRLMWQVHLWIVPVIAALIPYFIYLPPHDDVSARILWALRINELYLPLLGVIICSNAFSQEWEKHVADIWLAKPTSRLKLVLTRMATIFCYMLFVLLVPICLEHFTYVHLNWGEMLLTVFPSALFLGSLGMLIGVLTHNSAVAFLVPMAHWLFEMATKGEYTGLLNIFSRTTHYNIYDAESFAEVMAAFPWITSKLIITGAGLCLVLLAAWVLHCNGKRLLPQRNNRPHRKRDIIH
jgi:hypothetical protein